jgi:hypothetical protein
MEWLSTVAPLAASVIISIGTVWVTGYQAAKKAVTEKEGSVERAQIEADAQRDRAQLDADALHKRAQMEFDDQREREDRSASHELAARLRVACAALDEASEAVADEVTRIRFRGESDTLSSRGYDLSKLQNALSQVMMLSDDRILADWSNDLKRAVMDIFHGNGDDEAKMKAYEVALRNFRGIARDRG